MPVLCVSFLFCLKTVNSYLSASYLNTVSYNVIWKLEQLKMMVKSRCPSSSWHLFRKGFFSVDLPCFHFMLVATLPFHHYPLSQSVIIPCRAQEDELGRGVVHIKVNDTETIRPKWKRNGRICWWRKGCKVMEGRWRDEVIKRMQVGRRRVWWNGGLLESRSTAEL